MCILNYTTSKKRTKIWTIDFFKFLNLKFSWKENSAVPIGWSLRLLRELRSLRCVRWMETRLHSRLLAVGPPSLSAETARTNRLRQTDRERERSEAEARSRDTTALAGAVLRVVCAGITAWPPTHTL